MVTRIFAIISLAIFIVGCLGCLLIASQITDTVPRMVACAVALFCVFGALCSSYRAYTEL